MDTKIYTVTEDSLTTTEMLSGKRPTPVAAAKRMYRARELGGLQNKSVLLTARVISRADGQTIVEVGPEPAQFDEFNLTEANIDSTWRAAAVTQRLRRVIRSNDRFELVLGWIVGRDYNPERVWAEGEWQTHGIKYDGKISHAQLLKIVHQREGYAYNVTVASDGRIGTRWNPDTRQRVAPLYDWVESVFEPIPIPSWASVRSLRQAVARKGAPLSVGSGWVVPR